MEREIWDMFTLVRYTYTYETIYSHTVKFDNASNEAYLYTNVDDVEKSIRIELNTVDALVNLDLLSLPDMENVTGTFLGFSVTDSKGAVFSKHLSSEMEEEILTLLNPYLEALGADDGPDMEHQLPWTEFTLSRSDSNTRYSFWFTVIDNGDQALVTGECSDENGNSYMEETGIGISAEDLLQLRSMALEQIPEEEPWPDDLELPTDMATITLTLTLSDGTVVKKNISSELSIEIYTLLLHYLKNI